jgi:hypothetical protein
VAFAGGYVDIPNSASIQNLGSVTLEAWVYWTGTGSGEQFIMTKGTQPQWDLEVYRGRLTGQVGPTWIQDSQSFPQNSWQYVAMSYDGSTLRVYRNGSLVASQTVAAPIASTADLFIGHYFSGAGWTGRIDEPAIYNSALSATTIQSHYSAAAGSTTSSPPPAPTGVSATAGSGQVLTMNPFAIIRRLKSSPGGKRARLHPLLRPRSVR